MHSGRRFSKAINLAVELTTTGTMNFENSTHISHTVSGVTIVTPIRKDPGRVRSPTANVWAGRATRPKSPPHGKKAGIRSQIDHA